MDYVEGWYEGNADRMERCLHSNLAKREVVVHAETGRNALGLLSATMMTEMTRAGGGKVLYVGSSNFAGWNIAQACEKAAVRNFLGLVCEQSAYNLGNRAVESEVIPACQEYGLGLVPYSPLGGGWLAGILQKAGTGQGRRGRTGREADVEANRNQLEAYESLCRELGEEPAAVALAWLLKNPVVTAPLIGPRMVEQLSSSLRALEISLDDEALVRLNEIWPGPGPYQE